MDGMGRLTGKTALVTGGARGMGAAQARLLAHEGATVVIADILDDEGLGQVGLIEKSGGRATYRHLDVSEESDWIEAVDSAVEMMGGLHVLVNNAGIGQRLSIEETSEELWDRVMAVNARGPFLGVKHSIPHMRRAGGGSVINISSIAGIVAGGTSAVYHASKAAVRLFTKAAALQLAPYGIRVNSIHPGDVITPMTAAYFADPANVEDRIRKTPLGRIGTPEDVAQAVLFLASDESSYMTGAELVLDGGRTAQ